MCNAQLLFDTLRDQISRCLHIPHTPDQNNALIQQNLHLFLVCFAECQVHGPEEPKSKASVYWRFS